MKSKGYEAWLGCGNGTPLAAMREEWKPYLKTVAWSRYAEEDKPERTAVDELETGIEQLTGQRPACGERPQKGSFIALGVIGRSETIDAVISGEEANGVSEEAFFIRRGAGAAGPFVAIAGKTGRGLLYGVFHFLRLLRLGEATPDSIDVREQPRFGLRMINQWDNMDGSVERGYAGNSIFFRNGEVLSHSPRLSDYARLLASVGINGIAINNVNVHKLETKLITEQYLPDVAKVAEVFRSYGIKLYLSVNFAGPVELAELETADPLDDRVKQWWKERASDVYRHVPDFGGFLVKADSENRPGPFTYDRDHADGANMLAEALEPHGGIVLWRCFVYNCHQDWRDRSTDRARAAYDHFKPLDGKFRDNVLLQIKNGPMDFQVREPVSPLFGAMPQTNHLMEFQITQEYTGQQRHVCYLVPQWKEVLDFDTRLTGEGTLVKHLAAGEVHSFSHSGIAAVSNIGDDDNWTGHHLAQANLYGYGRLIWNPELEAGQIAKEWAIQTFGSDGATVECLLEWLLGSWHTYESYTAPLGVGWMVTPHYHYGPDVDGYEYSKWGTYHFADHRGIGVNRTVASGTGYTAQYEAVNADLYENIATCPDELLLFFHHVPYTHRLRSGKTVIQHIYDTHFDGAEQAEARFADWLKLEGKVDAERFAHVADRAKDQAEHARLWRDVINTYFYRKSGISDERGRLIYD